MMDREKARRTAEELESCSFERALELGLQCESWEELETTLAYLLTGSAPWYDRTDGGEGG